MIEKLLDFLTSKNSIENSKLIRTFCYLIMGILASSWYSYSLHKYTLNFDYKFLSEFIFSGQILPCLLIYSIIYFSNEISGMMLYALYSLLMYKVKKKVDITIRKQGKIKTKKDYLKIRDAYKPILISLGVLQIVKGEPKMDAEMRKVLKKYCDEPRVIVVNIIRILIFSIMTYITYNITVHDLPYIPHWLNYTVTTVFCIIVFIVLLFIFFSIIFEINIPALRLVHEKVKPFE
jgi:hypothetical protein